MAYVHAHALPQALCVTAAVTLLLCMCSCVKKREYVCIHIIYTLLPNATLHTSRTWFALLCALYPPPWFCCCCVKNRLVPNDEYMQITLTDAYYTKHTLPRILHCTCTQQTHNTHHTHTLDSSHSSPLSTHYEEHHTARYRLHTRHPYSTHLLTWSFLLARITHTSHSTYFYSHNKLHATHNKLTLQTHTSYSTRALHTCRTPDC